MLNHKVTTKDMTHPYDFSLALHTGEKASDIIKNRHLLAKAFDTDKVDFIVANQTHSDHINIITEQVTQGWEGLLDVIEDCDALITNQRNIVLTILTADCVPILLYDKDKQIIAAIHAGWKGTKAEIVTKTIAKMREVFNTNPKNIIAGIAPSIGQCCYEVGKDVANHFSHIAHAYTAKNNKYMLDLPYINKQQLIKAGVLETHIEMAHICTACKVDIFFSYRQEEGCSGRFMSMIGLKGKET
jgi:YfiH family protein